MNTNGLLLRLINIYIENIRFCRGAWHAPNVDIQIIIRRSKTMHGADSDYTWDNSIFMKTKL